MVELNRIYTRTGDGGETMLGDGSRVPKTHPRVLALGSVDELNSVLGLTLLENAPKAVQVGLRRIQNELFDLGADLSCPETDETNGPSRLRLPDASVEALEALIDGANRDLRPLDSFILPGGTPAAARLHHARTVCRRAEIAVLELAESETINTAAGIYLNRLSDLLFVWARLCNDGGAADIKWIPGGNQS